ncbi:uncharacterized protein OCT59_019376 [Rhizophagus irregularis]|uniref:uncharacterized protein n=1 Tax=Rhizophagus irregularis TaxID=588596 RepID=UPI00332B06BA|nr:hypothetical protein OCT59_019376 [Rhizophagus irregularis]
MNKNKKTSLQEKRVKSQTPYSHQDDSSYSKKFRILVGKDNVSLNRNRSNSPYTHQDNVSLNRNRGRTRDNVPLNRSRSNSPYARQDNVSLNRNRKRRESNVGEENHGRNKSRERNLEEISELRTAISDLGREVRGLRQEKEDQPRTQHSWSPDPSSTRYTKDEIVQILKGLDDSLTIDHKNRWTDIERHVTQDTIPAIKRVLGNKFQYTDIELKKVLQNLHRHRRDAYNVSKDPLKSKVNKRRTGINTRRKDKKERRQRGFRHMLSRRDQKLTDLQPSIPWDDWIEGLEAIINDSSYHSDEISESDEEIRNFLRHADLTGESIRNIKVGRKRWYNDQLYIENNSKPPRNAAWAISSSYRSE